MILSHYCFCSAMPGQSYCFMWDNDAINLKRSLPLHFNFFFNDMLPRLLAYRYITLIKALILVWLQMLIYSITSNSTGYTECYEGWASDTALHGVWELLLLHTCNLSRSEKQIQKQNKKKKPAEDSMRKNRVVRKSPYHSNKHSLSC